MTGLFLFCELQPQRVRADLLHQQPLLSPRDERARPTRRYTPRQPMVHRYAFCACGRVKHKQAARCLKCYEAGRSLGRRRMSHAA